MMPRIVSKSETFPRLTLVTDHVYVVDDVIDPAFLAEVIDLLEQDVQGQPGEFADRKVDKRIKDSTDFFPEASSLWVAVYNRLIGSLEPHFHEFMDLNGFRESGHLLPPVDPEAMFGADSGFHFQKTELLGKFVWHCDDTPAGERTLVVILYLNEVIAGGETTFLQQDLKVEPRAARLLLFPPYWTHVHCGKPVHEGVKYILTGWLQKNISSNGSLS
jgi:hypothetical protein